jgi:hypothetical protein
LEERHQQKLVDVPLWDGLMTGELDALMGHSPASPKYTTLYAVASGARREFGAFVTELTDRVVRAASCLGRGGRWRRCAATLI